MSEFLRGHAQAVRDQVQDARPGGGGAISPSPADLDGLSCPQFAHIRKVNPRDAPTDLGGEARALALQIFRRGVPFGKPFDEGPSEERGLLLLGYTTAIEERFGRVNGVWINRSDAPEPGMPGCDLIAGQADTGGARVAYLRRNGREVELRTDRKWVMPTGGGFFFSPSVQLIEQLGQPDGGLR